jgi:anti-anti-sigma factor
MTLSGEAIMDIQSSRQGSATVVSVTGRMDAITAPGFEKTLLELIAGGETRFVVELAGLDYISSAGLRSILAIAKLLKGQGGLICFANVDGTVKEVFDISGFGSIFCMHESVADALAGLK